MPPPFPQQGNPGDTTAQCLSAPPGQLVVQAPNLRLRQFRFRRSHAGALARGRTASHQAAHSLGCNFPLLKRAMMIASSSTDRTEDLGSFGPVRRSAAELRFRHFATVLGLTP
jgi:hypothetical protein